MNLDYTMVHTGGKRCKLILFSLSGKINLKSPFSQCGHPLSMLRALKAVVTPQIKKFNSLKIASEFYA